MLENNFFKPYLILEFNDTCLHLAEPKGRKIFLFLYFRVYVILIAFAILFAVLAFKMPWAYKLLMVLVVAYLMLASQKKYLTEIKIGKEVVSITLNTFLGEKRYSTPLSTIEKITLESYYFSNGGGYQFKFVTKDGKKQIPFLTIPNYYMRSKNKAEIIETLEKITGLKVGMG
jgi:hypothetical protein